MMSEEIATGFDVFDVDPPADTEAVIPTEPPAEPKPSWKLLDMRLVLPRSGPELTIRLTLDADAARPVLEEAERLEAELRGNVGELVRGSPENAVYESAVARECQLREERKRLAASLDGFESEVDGAIVERLVEIAALETETKAMVATLDKAMTSAQRQRMEAEKDLRRRAVAIADEQRTKMMNYVQASEANASGLFAQASQELSELIKVGCLRGAITGALWGQMTAQRAVDELVGHSPPPPLPSCPPHWMAPFGPAVRVDQQFGVPAGQ